MEILSGYETKVLNTRGDFGVNERVLAECDVVIGVFHRPFCSNKKDYINALKEMIRNPNVNIGGHPTLFATRKGATRITSTTC
jgi:histidinol phosphatase-like PHP family hydrolase